MVLHMNGVVQGKRIDLDRETGLPDGASVTVQINPNDVPLDDVRRKLDAMCGVWNEDDHIGSVFAEMARNREARRYRDVSFDAPS